MERPAIASGVGGDYAISQPIRKPLPSPPLPLPREQPDAGGRQTIIDLSTYGTGRELRRRNVATGGPASAGEGGWSADSGSTSTSIVSSSSSGSSIGSGSEAGGSRPMGAYAPPVRVVERHFHHYYVPASEGGDALIDPATVSNHGYYDGRGSGSGGIGSRPIIEEYDESGYSDDGYDDDYYDEDTFTTTTSTTTTATSGDEGEFLPAGEQESSTIDRVLDEFYERHPRMRMVGAGTMANPIPPTAFDNPTLVNNCTWVVSCIIYCALLFCVTICCLIFFGVVTFAEVFGDPW